MFTGIVEEVGRVARPLSSANRLDINCALVLSDLTIGGSIAVNGVCLTAVAIRPDGADAGFSADLADETLARTGLGDLKPGDPVNLERPLMLQTRLSGHIVQGHVDGTGILEARDEQGITVSVPDELKRYLVFKGSICLDGISLTIAKLEDRRVTVAIIPHTWQATNLGSRRPGDRINIECDILAKHVDRLLSLTQTTVHRE